MENCPWILFPMHCITLLEGITLWPVWTGETITANKKHFSVHAGMGRLFQNVLECEPTLLEWGWFKRSVLQSMAATCMNVRLTIGNTFQGETGSETRYLFFLLHFCEDCKVGFWTCHSTDTIVALVSLTGNLGTMQLVTGVLLLAALLLLKQDPDV